MCLYSTTKGKTVKQGLLGRGKNSKGLRTTGTYFIRESRRVLRGFMYRVRRLFVGLGFEVFGVENLG